jgi:hypothetical protein
MTNRRARLGWLLAIVLCIDLAIVALWMLLRST